jgi:hypothetical protein
MLTRLAIFEGSVRAGKEAAIFAQKEAGSGR